LKKQKAMIVGVVNTFQEHLGFEIQIERQISNLSIDPRTRYIEEDVCGPPSGLILRRVSKNLDV